MLKLILYIQNQLYLN